ncbi:MAG: hypothetical protein ACLTNO_00870 [Blautia sp.]
MKNGYFFKFTGKYLLRVATLLIAVSVISFILVSLSQWTRYNSMWDPPQCQ